MAENEHLAEMNIAVRITSSFSSQQEDTSNSEISNSDTSNSAVLVSCGKCGNVNIIHRDKIIGNSNSDNIGKDETINFNQSVSNENQIFKITEKRVFNEADLCDIESSGDPVNSGISNDKSVIHARSSDQLTNHLRSSDKLSSPIRTSHKSASPERSSYKSDRSERSIDRPVSPERSSDKPVILLRSSDKSDSPEQTNDMCDKVSDKSDSKSSDLSDSSEWSDISDWSRDKSVSHARSSDRSVRHVRSSDKSLGPLRSSDKSLSPLRSIGKPVSPLRSSNKSDSPEQTNDMCDKSSDKSNCKSSDLSDSSEWSDISDWSSDKSTSPCRSSDKSSSSDSSSDNSESSDLSSDMSASLKRSSDKFASSDKSSNKSAIYDSSSDTSNSSDLPNDIFECLCDMYDLSNKSVSSKRSSETSSLSNLSNDHSDCSSSSVELSDISDLSSDIYDMSSENSNSHKKASNNSEHSEGNSTIPGKSAENSEFANKLGKNFDIAKMSSGINDSCIIIKLQTSSVRFINVEIFANRKQEKSELVNRNTVCIQTTGLSLNIPSSNLNAAFKKHLCTENDNFQVTEPFVNILEFTASGEILKIFKCDNSNIFILKDNTRGDYRVVYFNGKERHSEVFVIETNRKLDLSHAEKVELIKSNTEGLTKNITENIQSNDQFVNFQEMFSENCTDIRNNMNCPGDNLSSKKFHFDNKKNMPVILEETLNDELNRVGVTNNSQLNDVFPANCIESQQLTIERNKENQVCAYFKTAFDDKVAGSQVEDIAEYQNISELFGNDWITENLDSGNQLDIPFNSLDVLKNIKVICGTVLETFQSCISAMILKAKLKILPDSKTCAVTQTETVEVAETETVEVAETETVGEVAETETVGEVADLVIVAENTNDKESVNDSDNDISPGEDSDSKSQITNFWTLLKHLTAEAGTDVTAEQVKEDINAQVVLDIYNGFHELRTVDYGNLDLMEKYIRGCLSSLQNTMLKSNEIVKRSSQLLRVEANSLEEMRELNYELYELSADAEGYMHDIDRSLTGLKDFTDDYLYYKKCISQELGEFLIEDFPEIFK